MVGNAGRSTAVLTYLGGPTALIAYGGLRLLTDPTFDAPGEYPIGERTLLSAGPAEPSGRRARCPAGNPCRAPVH